MRSFHAAAAAGLLGLGLAVVPAAGAHASPDTDCMRAGMATLRGAGLLPAVAKNGLPIETAVSVGVTPRPDADLSGVPDPIPLAVVLADHRAGDQSLFVYPWCS